MPNSIDDALSGLLGKRRNYTLEEIRAAQRQKRRSGGNLIETLEKMTGRTLPDIGKLLEEQKKPVSRPAKSAAPAVNTADELQALCQEAEAQMAELEKQLQSPAAETKKAAEPAKEPVGAESFDGLTDELSQEIFGQDAFLKKLVIAFKRPFVMPPKKGFPRNAIYVSGPKNTGRHSALTALVEELQERSLFSCPRIHAVDLSLYPGTGEEKLFLQDLYAALQSESAVLVFEHFEQCHPSYLNMLSQLVIEGKCTLSARYMLQEGQLIGVNNALAA